MSEYLLESAGFVPEKTRYCLIERACRMLVHRQLRGLTIGEVILHDSVGVTRFGRRSPGFDLSVNVHIRNLCVYQSLGLGGFNAFAEEFMEGRWTCDDLTALVRVFVRNPTVMQATDGGAARLAVWLANLAARLGRNSRAASRRDIAAHYDLGNDFFRLMLDETMMYSCAIFERPDASLADASRTKLDRICRKLQLGPADHLLEIGTGWGGFALHAAQKYGCRVTTTTISRQQYEHARQRVEAAGLSDRVEVICRDYRDLAGSYDKLVSIEMIEAVGHAHLGTFFEKCASLLKPDGMMLLQAITISDGMYEQARRTADFIKRYIFPGSCIPSLAVMCGHVARRTDLRLFHLEDIGPHYATTLRRWRENFFSNLSSIRAMGYTEPFLRAWDLYLAYCEGGFAERYISNAQMLLTKPLCRRECLLPPGI